MRWKIAAGFQLPMFTADGVLPIGDYPLTIKELGQSHLVTGLGNPSKTWDHEWREYLVTQLDILVSQLWSVGIDRIFVDGSFVENKDHPHDIDGYFECELMYLASRQLHTDLNKIDPFKIWTWDPAARRPETNTAKMQLPMWHRYHVELYPHFPGNLCGIKDEFGNDLQFPAAFRKSRTANRPKGIVQIVRELAE